MRHPPFLTLTFGLAIAAVLAGCTPAAPAGTTTSSASSSQATLTSQDKQLVEAYLSEHIGSLSPTPPVVGGSFHVTDVSFRSGNRAAVQYEDGHIALTGIATFAIRNGAVEVNSFDLAPEPGQSTSQGASTSGY
jgi:hypothetical protein